MTTYAVQDTDGFVRQSNIPTLAEAKVAAEQFKRNSGSAKIVVAVEIVWSTETLDDLLRADEGR